MPFLEDLYEITRENVHLAVRDGTELVFVERIAGRAAVPVHTRVGGRFALHATGVGLVLLAHAPLPVQEAVLAGPLQRYSTKTINDPNELRGKLAAIRHGGFAISDGQVTTDAVSIAAPIHGDDGEVVASLSLVLRVAEQAPMTLVPVVRSAARAIGRTLASGRPSIPRPTDGVTR